MIRADMDKFWAADEIAKKDNCFNPDAGQVAMEIRMSEECVYAELQEEGDPWNIGALPAERRIELNKRYNEKAVSTVGIPLLPESFDPPDSIFPQIKRIGEVFGGSYETGYKTGEWLHHPALDSSEALTAQLDKVDKLLEDNCRGLKSFIYPDNRESVLKTIKACL